MFELCCAMHIQPSLGLGRPASLQAAMEQKSGEIELERAANKERLAQERTLAEASQHDLR